MLAGARLVRSKLAPSLFVYVLANRAAKQLVGNLVGRTRGGGGEVGVRAGRQAGRQAGEWAGRLDNAFSIIHDCYFSNSSE